MAPGAECEALPTIELKNGSKVMEIAKLVIVVLACCGTMATTVFWTGRTTGHVEAQVAATSKSVKELTQKFDVRGSIVEEMRREAAYQKGVVNTKLDTLCAEVGDIKMILSNWEPE